MRALCIGEIREDLIFPFPEMKEPEQQLVKDTLRLLAVWLNDHSKDVRGWMRPENFLRLSSRKLLKWVCTDWWSPRNSEEWGFQAPPIPESWVKSPDTTARLRSLLVLTAQSA